MSGVRVPPLKIQGIKTKIVPFIMQSIEWNGSGRWIEPFVGSAVVLLNVNPGRALLGDTNLHVINFYKSLQQGALTSSTVRGFLEREGENLRCDGENHYYRVRERFNAEHDPHDFLFLNRACFNGVMRFNRAGGFNTPFCRKPERFSRGYITKICNQVAGVAERMRGRDWEFVCSDWAATLANARDGDFVYADPPYEGRSSGYFNTWTAEDALGLESRLKALPCPFLYSMWSENRYRRNDRLHQDFANYEIKTITHHYHLGATENLRNRMTEALVVG